MREGGGGVEYFGIHDEDCFLYFRQCQKCCVSSGDELIPTIADFDQPASRCGRKIQRPKALVYADEQVPIATCQYTWSYMNHYSFSRNLLWLATL